MWKKIHETDCFLSILVSQNYEIYVTDFISIWSAIFSEKAFLAQLKNSNEGLLLECDKDYVDNGLYLLSAGIDTLKYCNLQLSENIMHMTVRTLIPNLYPFGFECKLSKDSNEFFFQKVTQPLLKTVSELKSSEHALIQVVQKKDIEIKAYKRELENKEIIFRHEVTKEFSNVEHKKIYRMYDKIFGPQEIPKGILAKSTQLPESALAAAVNITSIKQEPNSIEQETDMLKREPDLQEGSNIKEVSNNIKKELNEIKQEPYTAGIDVCAAAATCNQHVISESTERAKVRSKKPKLNY